MWLPGLIFLLHFAALVIDPGELLAPVLIQAGGQPLDVKRIGHAAPFVGDFYGKGRNDLLVGQFHEGRLRIYQNAGTATEPRYDAYTWFKAGSDLGRVPTA